jgi:iron complex transport system ATP-binding protein
MSELVGQGINVMLGGKPVLQDVDVTIRPGRLTAILGRNGAGKSTLVRALLGYLPLASGRLLLDGRDHQTYSDSERARQIGYLAQGHQIHWPLPVEQVVELGRLPHRYSWIAITPSDRQAVEYAMQQAGVTHLRGRTVDSLSGGKMARVLLARVLAGKPRILLADEPLAGLDPAYQLHIIALLRTLSKQGLAVALVMHDLSLAGRFCDHVVLLHHNTVLADGAPAHVLTNANLVTAFDIEACYAEIEGHSVLVPWQTTAEI